MNGTLSARHTSTIIMQIVYKNNRKNKIYDLLFTYYFRSAISDYTTAVTGVSYRLIVPNLTVTKFPNIYIFDPHIIIIKSKNPLDNIISIDYNNNIL